MGYIADTYPEAGLTGDGSVRQRAEAMRWLAFVNSDRASRRSSRCSDRRPSFPIRISTPS